MSRGSDTEALKQARTLDLATAELDYDGFRALAQNPHLSAQEKIGFPPAYREGFEAWILADILSKLPALRETEGQVVVDIGPGCAALPRMLAELCRERRHRLILVDSPEMLALLPDDEAVIHKCAGRFPLNVDQVLEAAGRPADAILCYSVLHYIFVDSNLFDFADSTVRLLAPGGRALIGDIPNVSKRRRFFASEHGQRFHQEFTGASEPYQVNFNEPSPGKIDDAVLAGIVQRVQAAGCDAYLMPQAADLPMANRRDDLLIMRP
ncbi:MAG TPA: class I SAM-dependent methyltransferase [Caulobacteraceae bacterium]|jgi:hypothetical protein|nr:class I SAM-dependent methyltransferase [Caulobacteraceae bacterium]